MTLILWSFYASMAFVSSIYHDLFTKKSIHYDLSRRDALHIMETSGSDFIIYALPYTGECHGDFLAGFINLNIEKPRTITVTPVIEGHECKTYNIIPGAMRLAVNDAFMLPFISNLRFHVMISIVSPKLYGVWVALRKREDRMLFRCEHCFAPKQLIMHHLVFCDRPCKNCNRCEAIVMPSYFEIFEKPQCNIFVPAGAAPAKPPPPSAASGFKEKELTAI